LADSEPDVVACIPAFNEEGRIASVIVRARRRVDAVVVCDDDSGDLTGEIAEGLGAVGCGMTGAWATAHTI
jgi:glycosyltransferase involved in cell wall biosynthesis